MVKYMSTSLQLYLPPDYLINRDFLKLVLTGRKKLIPLKDVKYVNVPKYEELSVEKMWPIMKPDAEFMAHFPDTLPKGRNAPREYFWNVLNTVHELYVQRLISHAH